jgi:hypothetical protein
MFDLADEEPDFDALADELVDRVLASANAADLAPGDWAVVVLSAAMQLVLAGLKVVRDPEERAIVAKDLELRVAVLHEFVNARAAAPSVNGHGVS